MEKEILKEICEDLNLKEKIVVKLFLNCFILSLPKISTLLCQVLILYTLHRALVNEIFCVF